MDDGSGAVGRVTSDGEATVASRGAVAGLCAGGVVLGARVCVAGSRTPWFADGLDGSPTGGAGGAEFCAGDGVLSRDGAAGVALDGNGCAVGVGACSGGAGVGTGAWAGCADAGCCALCAGAAADGGVVPD